MGLHRTCRGRSLHYRSAAPPRPGGLRYKNGVDSCLNVLTAQTDLYNPQLALVATRLQRLTNLVDLYRALGGGWIQRSGDKPRPPTG